MSDKMRKALEEIISVYEVGHCCDIYEVAKKGISTPDTYRVPDKTCQECGALIHPFYGCGTIDGDAHNRKHGTGQRSDTKEAEIQMSDDFDKAAHKYLMDNQDSTMTQNISELLGDWALDAFNAGWDARQERIKELERVIRDAVIFFGGCMNDGRDPDPQEWFEIFVKALTEEKLDE